MQLYTFPPSPNSLRCQAVANQLGIELELIPLDLTKQEHLTPEFIALNPNHKIPTLVDGDFVLWESGAIMLYLAQSKPGNELLPGALQERVRMAQWLFWNTAHWSAACGAIAYEKLVKDMLGLGAPDQAKLNEALENLARFGAVLNAHLKGRAALVGDGATLADHAIVSWLPHAERLELPLAEFAEIRRWSADLLGAPAWRQALATIPES